MKKSLKITACLLTAAMLTASLTACGGSGTTNEQTAPASPASQTGTDIGSGDSGSADSTAEKYLDVTGIDFSHPSIVITYDDFDGMQDLAHKMQNFNIEADTVVEIDGEVGSSMMTHSIVVPNAEHSQRTGTTFEVVGMSDSDVPGDETRIHIVGVVRANNYNVNVLVVPADQFKIVAQ